MKQPAIEPAAATEPVVIPCAHVPLADLLGREWLLSNRIGAYASSTVAGCNTRRYHGLLVAATAPPMGRLVTVSQLSEQLSIDGESIDLATIEFPGTVQPNGAAHLAEFRNEPTPTFVFRRDGWELVKQIVLADSANAAAVRYVLRGRSGRLCILPFVALRDFHHLRKADEPHQMTFETVDAGCVVNDRERPVPPLYLLAPGGQFEARPEWWYRFHYRTDLTRGQEAFEDLYAPGAFALDLADGVPCQIVASSGEPRGLDVEEVVAQRQARLAEAVARVGPGADRTTRRLAAATDAFVVRRSFPNTAPRWTILAGYHWFADWGRDAFIALPGLLLSTGRFDQARDVFRTFAAHIGEGMVPNRFDDYSGAPHYNSIDASLWFILAAERYLQATGDADFWRSTLMPAAIAIVTAYQNGTRFDIHADADGLLTGGSEKTQLTWMDVALGDEAVTPRHGRCVEINALWHEAHCILADRCAGIDDRLADPCRAQAARIAEAFNRAFWNERQQCLYDCISNGRPNASIRPNQVFAVSVPHSPLPVERQRAVVQIVREKLLTPFGLRSLSPDDPRYRRRYGGSWESRDRAYHQGTVWGWLIGPFIEAYLKVQEDRGAAIEQARQWLAAFDDHLETAGVGYVSEIFDGDPPHAPRGCIAQAWSVGELLRAKRMVESP